MDAIPAFKESKFLLRTIFLKIPTTIFAIEFYCVCCVGRAESLRTVVSWLMLLAETQDFQLRLSADNTCDRQLLYHHVCQTTQSSFCWMATCDIKFLMAASSSLNRCKHPRQWTVSGLQQSVGKLTRGGSFPAHCWHLANARQQRQQAGIQWMEGPNRAQTTKNERGRGRK